MTKQPRPRCAHPRCSRVVTGRVCWQHVVEKFEPKLPGEADHEIFHRRVAYGWCIYCVAETEGLRPTQLGHDPTVVIDD